MQLILDRDYQTFFGDVLVEHLPAGGRVLEVGAGPGIGPRIRQVRDHVGHLTGVDPSAEVLANPDLDERVRGTLEAARLPPASFDGAYAVYVAEHVPDPKPFLRGVAAALKPGAWFWVLTPNAVHPFAALSRSLEGLGLKDVLRRVLRGDGGEEIVNDYPAYYRMNNPYKAAGYGGRLFAESRVYLVRADWGGYFPRRLRWVPRAWDGAFRRAAAGQTILIYGLRRAAGG